MTINDLLRRLFGTADSAFVRKVGEDPAKIGLQWRVNIVDLLKVLDLDTSLQSRQELADDLAIPYASGTKEENRALQTAVMDRLRAFEEMR